MRYASERLLYIFLLSWSSGFTSKHSVYLSRSPPPQRTGFVLDQTHAAKTLRETCRLRQCTQRAAPSVMPRVGLGVGVASSLFRTVDGGRSGEAQWHALGVRDTQVARLERLIRRLLQVLRLHVAVASSHPAPRVTHHSPRQWTARTVESNTTVIITTSLPSQCFAHSLDMRLPTLISFSPLPKPYTTGACVWKGMRCRRADRLSTSPIRTTRRSLSASRRRGASIIGE